LFLITSIWNGSPLNINFFDTVALLPAFVGLTFVSPFLAIWYLVITFWEFRKLELKNWWQVPSILITSIIALILFWQVIKPKSL